MRVKALREEKNITQPAMSELLGISVPNYSKKENGEVKFSLFEAKVLADFFGVSIEDLFFDN